MTSKSVQRMLQLISAETIRHANCPALAQIFELRNWKWAGDLGEESYVPLSRDIRRSFVNLAKSCIESVVEDYEQGKWDGTRCLIDTGRLYFSIDWEPDCGKEPRLFEDIRMTCGIFNEDTTTYVDEVTEEGIKVNTIDDYMDEHEATHKFPKDEIPCEK